MRLEALLAVQPVSFYDGSKRGTLQTHSNASPYGAFDMAGNVMEWCQDWYARDYYAVSPRKNVALLPRICPAPLSLSNCGMSAVSRRQGNGMQSWYRFRVGAGSWRSGLAGLASGLVAACCTSDARADLGWGFGPVLAITARDSPSLGWELTALGDNPLWARWALGGNYSWAVQGDDPAYAHYLVWEPWLYAGGTLGVALADRFQPRVAYGVWEGVGVSLDSDLFDRDDRQWVVSLAIGWRAAGGTHQFYLTPKLWRMNGWRLNS